MSETATDLDALIGRLRRDRYVGDLEKVTALRLANESPKHGLNGVAIPEPEGERYAVVVEGKVA